jgi:crotonobetainyl-CoA:carnitine CoA-transferase CaiB-like acyl-CoA transferase
MTLSLLSGVVVLDIGRLMPSSIATFELAKLGADVVKVEFPPDGDYLRINPPHIAGRGDMHLDINRNKRSVCLDPRSAAGGRALRTLIGRADVVVVAARPSSLRPLSLDGESCRAINPSLIHCSISGYGADGPYSGLAAHGLSSDAAAGIVPIVVDADGRRVVAPDYISVGPRAAGLHAALAITASLYERHDSGGAGRDIDVAQWDSALAWNYRNLDQYANTGERIPSYLELGFRYALYATSDGKEVLLAAPEPRIWRRFCEVVGRPELAALAGDGVIEFEEDPVGRAELEAIFRTRSQEEWIQLAARIGVPIAPVIALESLPTDPHVAHRDMLVSGEHPLGGTVSLTGHPTKYRGDTVAWTRAPELGEHTAEVLRHVGVSDEDVMRIVSGEQDP